MLGTRRRERDALADALCAAGAKVRVERAFDEEQCVGAEGSVVLDVADAAQVIDAARGCNILYHVAAPVGAPRGAAIARSLMRVARESEVTRVIVISDASTLAKSAQGVGPNDRGVPGRGWAEQTEGLYALERGLARAAADGLHASVLMPGYVWHGGELNAVPQERVGSGRLTVVGVDALNAAAIAMVRRGRAGERYTLAGVRTWAREWRSWLEGRGELGGEDAFQCVAASGDRWLEGAQAEHDLRLQSPTSLDALARSR